MYLTHWGRVMHICVSKLTIIGSDNGLMPGRRQAIIRTNAGIFLIQTLGTNLSEILWEIHSFSFSKMHLKMSSATWRLFGLGLNELMIQVLQDSKGSPQSFWMKPSGEWKLNRNHDIQWNFEENMYNLVVNTVPADGLAPYNPWDFGVRYQQYRQT